jgi:transposase
MKLYSGIDLHSSNSFVGVINEQDQRLFRRKLPNDLSTILQALDPFKESLEGVVVESTFNWYWLVDGLMENGYKVHLANPSAIKQYEGLKHTDDNWDSFWLAHLLRLGILPEGYIYPKETRSVRDFLRRRLIYVKHKTTHILSLQSLFNRALGIRISSRDIYKLKEENVKEIFDDPNLVTIVKHSLGTIHFLKRKVKEIEKDILGQVKLRKEFILLKTIPGIGDILALTIMLEVGDITRFKKVGNYSSYCRCVKTNRLSNNKSKGKGNSKNGNKYLSWAFVEAAHFAKRFCPEAEKFYHRKIAKTKEVVARKALANKIARASFYIMRDQVAFDVKKLFA